MEAEGQNTLPTEPVLRVEEKKLVVTFIQFLRQKVSANECTEAQIEGLEVAVQCLENAFGLTDKNYAFQPGKSLLQIFTEAEGVKTGEEEFPTPTQQDIDRANSLKEEGNELVKTAKFQEAIEKYNQAIKLNRDPVYFCNRAAAYCRLEQYDLAIQDCRTAIALDENYAKAYGRLGLALSCQNRYDAAIEAYTKALELDPNNESYKSNKTIAEEKVREAQQRFQANPGMNPFGAGLGSMFGGGAGAGPGGMPDLGSMLNNPQMMQAAMQMMNDPNMQNLMSSMMESFMGGSGGAGGGNMADLLAAGQSMAQQMQNANPELVEQLRRQFAGSSTSDNPNQDQQGNNPPNNPPPQ